MRRQIVAAAFACSVASAVAAAQMRTAAVPRGPDGHPDLTGVYDLAMLTPLERPNGMPAVMSDEEAARLEQQVVDRNKTLDQPIAGTRSAPPKGGGV